METIVSVKEGGLYANREIREGEMLL